MSVSTHDDHFANRYPDWLKASVKQADDISLHPLRPRMHRRYDSEAGISFNPRKLNDPRNSYGPISSSQEIPKRMPLNVKNTQFKRPAKQSTNDIQLNGTRNENTVFQPLPLREQTVHNQNLPALASRYRRRKVVSSANVPQLASSTFRDYNYNPRDHIWNPSVSISSSNIRSRSSAPGHLRNPTTPVGFHTHTPQFTSLASIQHPQEQSKKRAPPPVALKLFPSTPTSPTLSTISKYDPLSPSTIYSSTRSFRTSYLLNQKSVFEDDDDEEDGDGDKIGLMDILKRNISSERRQRRWTRLLCNQGDESD